MRYLLIAIVLLALPACDPRIVRVEVPVTVPCLGPAPAVPVYKFGAGEFPGEKEASKAVLSDLNAAKQYGTDLKTQMAGCK
jgi:hypothetical protein